MAIFAAMRLENKNRNVLRKAGGFRRIDIRNILNIKILREKY